MSRPDENEEPCLFPLLHNDSVSAVSELGVDLSCTVYIPQTRAKREEPQSVYPDGLDSNLVPPIYKSAGVGVQTCSGAHPVSSSMVSGVSFLGSQVATM
jgi:hypothetical protein